MDGVFKHLNPINTSTVSGLKTVINLSKSFILTAAQTDLLNKGLTFIPSIQNQTNKQVKDALRIDLQDYHRHLKLAVYYQDKPESSQLPFMPKSNWSPALPLLPPEVTQLIQLDLDTFHKQHKVGWTKPNLSRFERRALEQLSNNRGVVLKPADKGSAVVIMDRTDYLFEGLRQLNDPHYYKKLDRPIYQDTIPLVNKIVNSLYEKKFINHKQKTFLLGDAQPRPRRFYLLPKIHKAGDKWTVPHKIPPGRPIVSDCNSETYLTAKFIDHYLNPLSVLHDSYIKDTFDFVTKIKALKIPPSAFLFSLDVSSLYTNISTPEGLAAVRETFLKYPDLKRPDKELLQLLELNLTKNDFEFNGQFFLQVSGTAMGKTFAPSYADLFMARWEQGALASCPLRPLHYYRYLDDIWGVWDHSEPEFFQFLDKLNAHSDSITLTATLSPDQIDFLDTTTFKGPNFNNTQTLDVKVFFKETDSHSLLYRTSYHPKHTFAGLVKSQLLRFKRICTRQEDFKAATNILFSSLLNRGYTSTMLRQALRTFEVVKPISVESVLAVVVTFSESNVKFVQKLKRNFVSSGGENFLRGFRLIAAYRRNPNLQDSLVRSKLRPLNPPKTRRLDGFFRTYRTVQNQTTHEVFRTQSGLDVQTKNCVYLIRCSKCCVQYVGESGNTLLTRFTQHRYNITHKKYLNNPLVNHFVQHDWLSVRATILESNPNWTIRVRRKVERTWIKKLGTLMPQGLNER